MRQILLLAALCLVRPAFVLCAQTPRLLDNMENPSLYQLGRPEPRHPWNGEVALEKNDFKEGAGCLRFDIRSAKANAESYPQWARSLDPAENDWTGYRTLSYWVKVVSEDPKVTGKAMCVVVYNGDSPFQQFVRHYVPVGKWLQISDNLLNYNRDRVRGLTIYLYETDPEAGDDYTWRVDGLELVPREGDESVFDGMVLKSSTQTVRKPLQEVSAKEGLTLSFDASGKVAQVRSARERLSPLSEEVQELSGLLIRDWRNDLEPQPVKGKLVRDERGLKQTARGHKGLRINAIYSPVGDRLRCHITVSDTGKDDRPLTLYFALPIDAIGWTWWDDLRTPRRIEGENEFCYSPSSLRDPRVSPYPFCCIGNDREAISLATPLCYPRIQRMVYKPEAATTLYRLRFLPHAGGDEAEADGGF